MSRDKIFKKPQNIQSAPDNFAYRKDGEASAHAQHQVSAAQTDNLLAQLRNSERHFKLLVQSVTDYAIYMLDPTGIVASWNAGAERIKGYQPHEIVGKHFSQFFTDEDRAAGIPQTALETAHKKGRSESEGWRLRKDGTRFWAMAVIDAVRDEQGELLGFAKITRDMTERREAQERLERAQEQLAQSQKMEAIGHLTGGIAHDFNNLLMIVSGQAALMRTRAEDPRDLRSLDAIEQAAQGGANLTRQLLTFARRQRLNRVTVNLGERFKTFRDLLLSSVGGAVDLEIDVAPDIWMVETDVAELELALVNIAVNARDAMPKGGKLLVRASNLILKNYGTEALNGEFVAVSLKDSGEGIAPELMSKIFEPFFTTKEMGKGTGLGLSQVYGFARQAGGDVEVASKVGEGTSVTLYLPRSHADAPAIEQQPIASDALRGNGTILVVEDNTHVGEVSTLLLEQLGYDVLRVDRPAAALDLLSKVINIKLVLSDIVMPGDMDGLALANMIAEKFAHIPVLLATGYSSAAERVGAAFPILRKPYDINALGIGIKMALATSIKDCATA